MKSDSRVRSSMIDRDIILCTHRREKRVEKVQSMYIVTPEGQIGQPMIHQDVPRRFLTNVSTCVGRVALFTITKENGSIHVNVDCVI